VTSKATGTTLIVLVGLSIAFLLFMAFLNIVKSGNILNEANLLYAALIFYAAREGFTSGLASLEPILISGSPL
jgi:hypothetical protein